jgi:predicted MFS family arabinose efflux permease
LISAAAFTIFEIADAVWLLFLSRFVQGAGSGTTSVVQAYVSDSVPPSERAKALGWLTAATSAGVMLGPAIGSLSAAIGLIGPGFLAAGLCVLNLLFAWWWLPESSIDGRSDKHRKREPAPRGSTRRTILEFLHHPRGPVASLVWIYTMGMMAFMAMNGVFALYLERRFGIDETTIGWFFMYVGGVSLIMRSLVLGPTVARFGEVRVLRLGSLAVALGLAGVPFARNIPELGIAVLLIPVGTALLFPTTTSLVSHRAPESQTGLVLGVQQAYGGVARMIGPIWAGAAFQHFGIATPFWIAAGLMFGVWVFARGVTRSDPVDPALPDLEQAAP